MRGKNGEYDLAFQKIISDKPGFKMEGKPGPLALLRK